MVSFLISILKFWSAGSHDADFEHICIRVVKSSRCIDTVWFGSHGYRDGMWRSNKFKNEFRSEGKHVIVYAAKGSQ